MPKTKARYVCHRCAQQAPTCCRLAQPGENFNSNDCFPLSVKECGRIGKALSEARAKGPDAGSLLLLKSAMNAVDAPSGQAAWAVEEENSPSFIKAMCNLFPKEKARMKEIFPEGGRHSRLALDASGACVFLSEHGCVLPRKARPLFCRIFPFWIVGKTLQCFQDEDCLAVREHRANFMALMGAFDITGDDIKDRYAKLRREWGVDG